MFNCLYDATWKHLCWSFTRRIRCSHVRVLQPALILIQTYLEEEGLLLGEFPHGSGAELLVLDPVRVDELVAGVDVSEPRCRLRLLLVRVMVLEHCCKGQRNKTFQTENEIRFLCQSLCSNWMSLRIIPTTPVFFCTRSTTVNRHGASHTHRPADAYKRLERTNKLPSSPNDTLGFLLRTSFDLMR